VAGNADRGVPSPTRFLLDTNAFIALEPFAGQMESGLGPAATFMRLATKQGNRVFVHPATKDELGEGKDRVRAKQRIDSSRRVRGLGFLSHPTVARELL
jgi:hypothetical protein